MITWPTFEEVAAADRYQICKWYDTAKAARECALRFLQHHTED